MRDAHPNLFAGYFNFKKEKTLIPLKTEIQQRIGKKLSIRVCYFCRTIKFIGIV